MLDQLILAAFASGLLSAPQEGPVQFAPGTVWTYEGRVLESAEGRLEIYQEFPFQVRYLALEGEEKGECDVLVCIDFEAGPSHFGTGRREMVAAQWGTFLELASDLSVRTSFGPRTFRHPAADSFQPSPFPPADLPTMDGSQTAQDRAVKVGLYDYQAVWEWQVSRCDSGIRVELKPNSLPLEALRFGEHQQLEDFARAWEIDPGTGVLHTVERVYQQTDRHTGEEPTTWTFDLKMCLVEAGKIEDEELMELEDDLREVRELLLSIGDGASAPDEEEVEDFLEECSGSRIHAIARDVLLPAIASGQKVKEYQVHDADKARRLIDGPAPGFVGIDLEGEPVNLEALRGRVVMLNFWASW